MTQNKTALWVIFAHTMKKFDDAGFSRHRLGPVVGLSHLEKSLLILNLIKAYEVC